MTPTPSLPVPAFIVSFLDTLVNVHEVSVVQDPVPSPLDPFVSVFRWDLQNLPRDLDEDILSCLTKAGATLLCNVTTFSNGSSDDPEEGTALFRAPLLLGQLRWYLPAYHDGDSDASAMLTIHVAAQQAFFERQVLPELQTAYTQLVRACLRPLTHLSALAMTDPPFDGYHLGQQLGAQLLNAGPPALLQPFLARISAGLLASIPSPEPPPAPR